MMLASPVADPACRPDMAATGVAQALGRISPPGVGVGQADPAAPANGLWPAEAAAMAAARPSRLAEFAAGRRAARQAMGAAGLSRAAIPMGPDRAPVWPDGVVGSISHGGGSCLAAAAARRDCALIGLDIEPDAALPEGLAPLICDPVEARLLASRPAAARDRLARLLFSAKECAYKAQYPLSRQLLDFDALQVRLDLRAGRFVAEFRRDVAPFHAGDVLPGRLLRRSGLVVTLIALPTVATPARWLEATCA